MSQPLLLAYVEGTVSSPHLWNYQSTAWKGDLIFALSLKATHDRQAQPTQPEHGSPGSATSVLGYGRSRVRYGPGLPDE